MSQRFVLAFACCVLVFVTSGLNAQEVITYGVTTPQWKLRLHSTATRGSCSSDVDTCLRAVDALLRIQHTSRFYLNLSGDGQKIADQAAEYSVKSTAHPKLYEIGLDDFYSSFRKWCRQDGVSRCEQELRDILHNVKSANPKLKFGISLYDDKLKLVLADPAIPSALRAKIDTVHFYLHYRQNETKLASYIYTLKKSFPNAKIILGLYPYDRVDYLPCKQGGSVHCSPAKDKMWFLSSLNAGLKMSKARQISGIEFYPGNFGNVPTWSGWRNKKVCSPTRRTECIQNTEAMHNAVATVIHGSYP